MTSPREFKNYLAIETAGGPVWHPNENRISFASDATGVYQIYICNIEKGKLHPRRQLTNEEDRCTDPRYLHDGSIIFTHDHGGDENFQIGQIEEDGDLHWLTSELDVKHVVLHDTDTYLYFRANSIDRARFDLYRWRIPLRMNNPELIYKPESGLIDVSGVLEDERKILITQFLGNMYQQLLLLSVDSGDIENLTAAISGDNPTRWAVVRILDPNYILVNTDYDSDLMRLCIISMGGDLILLQELEEQVKFDIENNAHAKNSIWTYFSENEEGYSTLHRAKFTSQGFSDFETLPFPLRGVIPTGDARSWSKSKGISLSNSERFLAITMSSGIQPTSVWILDIKDMQSWRAVDAAMAGLDPSTFIEPTLHRFISFDSLSVPYFRYLPTSKMPADGWPTLLIIHGGPESQIRPDFNPVIQFYLAAGLAVITPNIRGSDGYGRNYLDLDNVEKRLDSIGDIRSLAIHIRNEEKEINADRLIIYGGSYGGFAVLSAMTEHPSLWKAGVDIVGISNFVTFLQNTAVWRRSLREVEYGSLEHDFDTLVSISPIHKIDRISAPLFIIQGDNDERVPLSESLQIYEQLRNKGLAVRLMRFADEGHGLAKLKNKISAYSEVLAWIKEIV